MKKKLKEYLFNLKVELSAGGRLDGWYKEWLHKKIKETEQKIKECD